MIKRIRSFLERVNWLAGYTQSHLRALLFLLRRRKNPAVTGQAYYNGHAFNFRGADTNALQEVLTEEEYQFLRPLLQAARPASHKPLVVFDIGAHVGLFALWCLKQNPLAEVYSLEANPGTYAVLQKNQRLRGLNNWRILNRAAWKNSDQIAFSDMRESMSSHVTQSGNITVQGISWDELTKQWPAHIDIMKIDIEGAEEAFITAAPHMLSAVQHLVIELHPNRCDTNSLETLLKNSYQRVVAIGGRQSTKPLLFCSSPAQQEKTATNHLSAHA